jgi:hypothetical protein
MDQCKAFRADHLTSMNQADPTETATGGEDQFHTPPAPCFPGKHGAKKKTYGELKSAMKPSFHGFMVESLEFSWQRIPNDPSTPCIEPGALLSRQENSARTISVHPSSARRQKKKRPIHPAGEKSWQIDYLLC